MAGWTGISLFAGITGQKKAEALLTDVALKQGIFIGISLTTTCLLASMATYFFFRGETYLFFIDSAFAAALLTNLFIYRRSHRLLPALRTGVSLGALTIICLTFFGDQGSDGVFLWFFTLPLGAIFLLGRKEGIFWTIFYFLILIEVMWYNNSRILDTYLIRFLVAYIIVALFAFIYESLRENMQENLRRTYDELSNAKKTLEKASTQISRYLSPQIRDAIFAGYTRARIESKRAHLTFFFSDIVDFTATTEHLEPEVLNVLLSSYLEEMSRIALKHGATIDKFIGDGIMVFFGAPESKGREEDAVACVRMALEMREKISEMQNFWARQGAQRPLQVRMGINSGYCTVGNFGTEDRMDFTAIGSPVNLASRLESRAEINCIFISRTTYLLVKDVIHCEIVGDLELKGLLAPVRVYEAIAEVEKDKNNPVPVQEEGEGYFLSINPEQLTGTSRQGLVTVLRKNLETLTE